MLKIFSTFAAQKNSKEEMLMNTLSIHPFFYDRFSIQSLDAKSVILAWGGGQIAVSQRVERHKKNDIDVESCLHILRAAFCAYQPD